MILDTVIDAVTTLGGKYFDSKETAAEFQRDVTRVVYENEGKVLDAAAQVMAADAQSESWLTRNARPLTVINMLVIFNVFFVTALIDPDAALKIADALQAVPSMVWSVILGGIGVYQLVRSVDKRSKAL